MDSRTPLLLGSHHTGDGILPVINCRLWRAPDGKPRCRVAGSPSVSDCMECQWRKPIVGRHPMRGLGDLVSRLVYVLCLGRPRIAVRIAKRADANRGSAPGNPGVSGCGGCARRQAALNRAISFQRNAH